MTAAPDTGGPTRPLRKAVVLATTEDACTTFAHGQRTVVPYARPFPTPRAERVAPGHLVAIATATDGSEVVVWRWFDAVVVDEGSTTVSLWEPTHGTVLARRRDRRHSYRPGGRAYVSAGLPGAPWWVAGPVVECGEDAAVELDEVRQFFTGLDLWDRLT